MYNLGNSTLVNTLMRFPVLAAPLAALPLIDFSNPVAMAVGWVGASVGGAFGINHVTKKVMKKKKDDDCDCDCDDMEWTVEYNPDPGKGRPWDVYNTFRDFKQHYASYSTKAKAEKKRSEMEKKTSE